MGFAEVLSKTYEKPIPFRTKYFFNEYVTPGSPPRGREVTTPGPVMTSLPTMVETPVDKEDTKCKCVCFKKKKSISFAVYPCIV